MCHPESVLSCVDHLDVKPYLSVDKVRILEGLPMMFKPFMTMFFLNSAKNSAIYFIFALVCIKWILCLSLTNVVVYQTCCSTLQYFNSFW